MVLHQWGFTLAVLPYLLSGYPMLGLAWIDDVHEYFHGSIEKVTNVVWGVLNAQKHVAYLFC